MKDKTFTVSLVICTYRRPEAVASLLGAIAGQSLIPDEILVVDSSPDTRTEETVRAFGCRDKFSALRYFAVGEKDRGLTRQRNFGIVNSVGDIVAFLDDDALPESGYFEEIAECFKRHPEAAGVGGYITHKVGWEKAAEGRRSLSKFYFDGWQRHEDYRWRLRRVLGLDSDLAPGWMPEWGHGRSVGFLPPNGKDYAVEFIMGGASAWRRKTFEDIKFSPYFDGYGLYEDLDFCIKASRAGAIYLCTKARVAHAHAPSGRPGSFQYGKMVVRNGWLVWRKRWSTPSFKARLKWWMITIVIAFCRMFEFRYRNDTRAHFFESLGRFWGMVNLIYNRPEYHEQR